MVTLMYAVRSTDPKIFVHSIHTITWKAIQQHQQETMHRHHFWYTRYHVPPLQSCSIAECLHSFLSTLECPIIHVVRWLLTYSTVCKSKGKISLCKLWCQWYLAYWPKCVLDSWWLNIRMNIFKMGPLWSRRYEVNQKLGSSSKMASEVISEHLLLNVGGISLDPKMLSPCTTVVQEL